MRLIMDLKNIADLADGERRNTVEAAVEEKR